MNIEEIRKLLPPERVDQYISECLELLDQSIGDFVREVPGDHPLWDRAMRHYAKWCALDQEVMDAHIKGLEAKLGRPPTTEEIYKDAP